MRTSPLIMLALAILFGALAVLLVQRWFAEEQSRLARAAATRAPQMPQASLVVAAMPLEFGTELTPEVLKEIPWPPEQLPQGAFAHVGELTATPRRASDQAVAMPTTPAPITIALRGSISSVEVAGIYWTVAGAAIGITSSLVDRF